MASRSNHGSPARADLFTGLKFWLSHQVPMKSYYKERLLKRGATIVAQEALADIRIVDDARKNLPTGDGYYSYKFVDESIKRNILANLDDHLVGTKSRADRQVGSVTIAAKGKRNPFTKEDDQILFNWLDPFRLAGGKWKGNDIYKQLEREHPQHTFQSWRHRYITLVDQGVKIKVTTSVDTAAPSDREDIVIPEGRSPKRRRLNATEPVITPKPSHQHPAPLPRSSLKSPPKQSSVGDEISKAVEAINGGSATSAPVVEKPVGLNASERQSNAHAPAGSDDLQPHGVAGEAGDAPQHQMDGQSDDHHITGVSDHQQPNTKSDSVSNPPGRSSLGPQSPSTAILVESISKAPVFSRKEKQLLYSIVPHIHSTMPEHLEESWKNVAASFGHHTPDEWRSLYQTAILPEYMSRNKLETLADLDDHTHLFLAEEQTSQMLKQEEATEEEASAEEEEDSDMFFPEKRSPRRDRSSYADSEEPSVDALRKASPELGFQMVLKAIEVKENGKTVANDRRLDQVRSLPPSTVEGPPTTAGKRLFGRRLDTDSGNLQARDQAFVKDPTPPNDLAFGEDTIASALVSSTSQSFASSKRPPESGQRPPKSLTTSQEGLVTVNTNDQDTDGHVSILDVLAATEKILEDKDYIPTAQRAESPTVNLLSDDIEEADGIASSPVPSDTGSEYMPFDTGPERSQLWDPSQDNVQDESDSDQSNEVSDQGFQIIQHASTNTPRKSVQKQSTSTRNANSPRHSLPSREADLEEHNSHTEYQTEDETEDESGDEDSLQPDVNATTSSKVGRRIETQALFQQSFANNGADITEFELPPPEGGWEQFGELEDDPADIQDAQDIRTSVELPEHGLMNRGSLILSMTAEETPEFVGKEDSPQIPLHEDMVVISDNESSHTTFSEDLEPVKSSRVLALHKQKPRTSGSSDGSGKTIPSHHGSTPDTSLEEDDGESASDDEATIELWFIDQPKVYSNLSSQIIHRLASTSLNATLFNLTAATFTMRDMVKSFENSEARRRGQFVRETRVKREYTDGTPQTRFKPKTRLTEEEARSLLPQAVIGVWTIEDDSDFLSKTTKGLERVEKKHGPQGVKKRAKFLKLRYGQEVLVGVATPRSMEPGSTRRRA